MKIEKIKKAKNIKNVNLKLKLKRKINNIKQSILSINKVFADFKNDVTKPTCPTFFIFSENLKLLNFSIFENI